jgi:branched-subunit amino acid ABC-type transport system permease component
MRDYEGRRADYLQYLTERVVHNLSSDASARKQLMNTVMLILSNIVRYVTNSNLNNIALPQSIQNTMMEKAT